MAFRIYCPTCRAHFPSRVMAGISPEALVNGVFMSNQEPCPKCNGLALTEDVVQGRSRGWPSLRETYQRLARVDQDGLVELRDLARRMRRGEVSTEAGVEQAKKINPAVADLYDHREFWLGVVALIVSTLIALRGLQVAEEGIVLGQAQVELAQQAAQPQATDEMVVRLLQQLVEQTKDPDLAAHLREHHASPATTNSKQEPSGKAHLAPRASRKGKLLGSSALRKN